MANPLWIRLYFERGQLYVMVSKGNFQLSIKYKDVSISLTDH